MVLKLEPGLAPGRALLGLLRALVLEGVLRVPGSRRLPTEIITARVRVRRLMNALADARAPACLTRVGTRLAVPGVAAGLTLGSDRPMVWSVASDPGRGPLEIRAEGTAPPSPSRSRDRASKRGAWRRPSPTRWCAPGRGGITGHPPQPGPGSLHPPGVARDRGPPAPDRPGARGHRLHHRDASGRDWPGLVLPRLEVGLPGVSPMTFTGVVRHVSSNGREHGETCGVELDVPSRPCRRPSRGGSTRTPPAPVPPTASGNCTSTRATSTSPGRTRRASRPSARPSPRPPAPSADHRGGRVRGLAFVPGRGSG